MTSGAAPGRFFLATAALGAVVVAWLYAQDLPLRAGYELDAFHHMAAVRELARGEFPPRHNLVPGVLPQGHYGPYLVSLGWLARITGASPIHVLYLAGVVNVLLYVGLFHQLALRLLGPGAARWAGIVPLVLWGPWPAPEMRWDSIGWPGTTALAEAYNFFYPNQAGLILVLGILALLGGSAGDPPSTRTWCSALVATAILVATHPLSALLLVSALMALGASWLLARRLGLRETAWLLALPPLGLLLAAAWPYYPVLKLLPAFDIAWFATGWAPPPAAPLAGLPVTAPKLPLLQIFGPAVVGVAGLLALARRSRPFPLLWFGVCILVLTLPVVPMRHRFSFFAVVPLHLGCLYVLDAAWRRGRFARAAALALLACGGLSAAFRLAWVLERRPPDLGIVLRHTPHDAVVLAPPGLSNGVAGLTGRKVVCPENPDVFLILAGGARRMYDRGRFFHNATPAERAQIIERWGATHVLVDRLGGRPLAVPGTLLAEADGLALYDVGGTARSTIPDSAISRR